MRFYFTRTRLLWGSVAALAFSAISYHNILIGRWPRALGLAGMVLLAAFVLFVAVTEPFRKSTSEEQARALVVFRNRMILWVVIVVVTYVFFKLNDRYHVFSKFN